MISKEGFDQMVKGWDKVLSENDRVMAQFKPKPRPKRLTPPSNIDEYGFPYGEQRKRGW